MFEEYSLQAREAIFLARTKAGERGAAEVQTEDLLVGLIIADQRGLARGASDLGKPRGGAPKIEPPSRRRILAPDLASELLASVEAVCARSQPLPNESDLPVAESVQRIFSLAASIRDELQQDYVEPLHLLAASLEEQSSRGVQILKDAGITREKIFEFIRAEPRLQPAELDERLVTGVGFQVSSPLYSQRARQVLFLARQEAGARGAEAIEAEDVLVALVTEDQGNLLDALSRFPATGLSASDLDLRPHKRLLSHRLANSLLQGLESLRTGSKPLPPADLAIAEGIKRALRVADRLRDELQQKEIEPLHLMAAMLHDMSCRGTQVFLRNGITGEKVIRFIREAT